TVKDAGVSHRFNGEICSALVGFTYSLQWSKTPASAIHSTERSAQLGLGSLTRCNGQRGRRQPSIQYGDRFSSGRVHLPSATVKGAGVSHPFNGEICSARVRFTYKLQWSKTPAS